MSAISISRHPIGAHKSQLPPSLEVGEDGGIGGDRVGRQLPSIKFGNAYILNPKLGIIPCA